MPKFFFGSMPASGTANIFIEMFAFRNRSQQFVSPCPLGILEFNGVKFPSVTGSMPYVSEIEEYFQTGFRSVDWTKNFDYLESYINKNSPVFMWFATFYPEVFSAVKEHFNDQVTTISINYTESEYKFVLDRWAVYQSGLIASRKNFEVLRKNFNSFNEIKEFCWSHGPQYFGYDIPKEKNVCGDVSIPIRDIYNMAQLKNILKDLGCSCYQTDWDFYSEYLKIC